MRDHTPSIPEAKYTLNYADNLLIRQDKVIMRIFLFFMWMIYKIPFLTILKLILMDSSFIL